MIPLYSINLLFHTHYLMDIEERRVTLETRRLLHFGEFAASFWRPSIPIEEVNIRFFRFLTNQTYEADPVLRAVFTCLARDDSERLIAFVPHDAPAFGILKSDKVALSEAEAEVVQRVHRSYVRPSHPYFTTNLNLPDTLRPTTVGKMMVWCLNPPKLNSV